MNLQSLHFIWQIIHSFPKKAIQTDPRFCLNSTNSSCTFGFFQQTGSSLYLLEILRKVSHSNPELLPPLSFHQKANKPRQCLHNSTQCYSWQARLDAAERRGHPPTARGKVLVSSRNEITYMSVFQTFFLNHNLQ